MRPAVSPAPAGYKTAVQMDVCARGSEPNPCWLRNSCRPEERVSTWRARTACQTGYRSTGPAPPGGAGAQLPQTTRPTVPHPATPARTHRPAHTTIHAHPPPHTLGPPSGPPTDAATTLQSSHNHHHHPAHANPTSTTRNGNHTTDHTYHQPAAHVGEPTITPDHTARMTHTQPAPNPKHPHRHQPR